MKDIISTIAEAVATHRSFDSMGSLDSELHSRLEYDRAHLALWVLSALAPIKTEHVSGVIDVTEFHRNLTFLRECGFSGETIELVGVNLEYPQGSY